MREWTLILLTVIAAAWLAVWLCNRDAQPERCYDKPRRPNVTIVVTR